MLETVLSSHCKRSQLVFKTQRALTMCILFAVKTNSGVVALAQGGVG